MAFEISGVRPLVLFLYALFMGVLFGMLYDIFRISRVMLTGEGIGSGRAASERIDIITKRIRSRPAGEFAMAGKIKNRMITAIIFVEDLLFFVICAVFFTIFLYEANFGQPRLYIYLASVAGFMLYYNTVGRLVAAMSGIAVSSIRLFLTFILCKALMPVIRFIARAISVPVYAYMKRSIIATGERETARLFMMSQTGFETTRKEVKISRRRSGHERADEKDKCSG